MYICFNLKITLLNTGEELTIIESWVIDNYPSIVFISFSKRKESESGMILDSPFITSPVVHVVDTGV